MDDVATTLNDLAVTHDAMAIASSDVAITHSDLANTHDVVACAGASPTTYCAAEGDGLRAACGTLASLRFSPWSRQPEPPRCGAI
jgi:hypothetical protein